jgi:hypothetical protein
VLLSDSTSGGELGKAGQASSASEAMGEEDKQGLEVSFSSTEKEVTSASGLL